LVAFYIIYKFPFLTAKGKEKGFGETEELLLCQAVLGKAESLVVSAVLHWCLLRHCC
jgi:hypothetical protein